MKLITLFACPSITLAASWSSAAKHSHIVAQPLNSEGVAGCTAHAEKFLTKPGTKDRVVESAMDNCALDKKVDDKNFVCPHYHDILQAAFRREPTTKEYDAKGFCEVAENYVSQMKSASRIPNMGKGAGFHFELSESCESTVAASFTDGTKKLSSRKAPDFWYALCMNQDCAHYLPSRTRWCSHEHAPTHSASVCEAVRMYASDEVFTTQHNLDGDLEPTQVCSIYDEFVEDMHVNVEAYMHVVYGTKEHPVPSPENKQRALESAKMKHQAKTHKLRDSAGEKPTAPHSGASTSLVSGLVTFASIWACRA